MEKWEEQFEREKYYKGYNLKTAGFIKTPQVNK
jgi:hypothetical protein